ncbi:hypothetical protein [Pleomorphomonas carboxyditropha]|uniref:SMODS and SLOG-associating 2TM effector domain-containing protein n=1 Tax=Pleomorphomonas carboxyditropha TaxID=2023338 RepID=A0A2G9WRD2_9HYPH|nr:hypothetical protein [Pleomorphomonas carboxyditropha]PIO97276.1 hypothetical protein CJ014_20905 [Pleomorphomonas carboxyditropha]
MGDRILSNEAIANHVWKYFEIHASQRLTVFNFFSAFSGLIIAGIGAVGQASLNYAVVGIALGAILVVVSFVFWKLDQRSAFLVKHAEEALKVLEGEMTADLKLFTSEPVRRSVANNDANWLIQPWTFGKSFRCLFLLTAICGLAALVFFIARLLRGI